MNDPKTATELYNQWEHIQRIAHNDFLDTLAAAMPYLLERKRLACRLEETRNPNGHEMIQALNKELAEVLLISYNQDYHQLNKK